MIETVSFGGGGTMVSTTLFFLRCSLGKGWRPTADKEGHPQRLVDSSRPFDSPYARLLLTVERYFIIGDRVAANYTIKGNNVVVNFPSPGKKQAAKTLTGE